MRGRKRVSMAGVCCYRPDATDARLAFHLREGAYDTAQLIGVVGALQGLLGGGWPVILVWDNLPAHTSLAMRAGRPSSASGSRSSTCPLTRRISNRWRACGPT
jgi:hypothetical protein